MATRPRSGLRFDEYLAMLRGHPKWKDKRLAIHCARTKGGMPFWRAGPPAVRGRPVVKYPELDWPAELAGDEGEDALLKLLDEEDPPDTPSSRRVRLLKSSGSRRRH